MDLALIAFLFFVFLVVFMAMVLCGPPRGWRCKGGTKHEFGQWLPVPNGWQERQCKVCGWSERAIR